MPVQQLIENLRKINLPDSVKTQIEELILSERELSKGKCEDDCNFKFLTSMSGDIFWRMDKEMNYTFVSDSIQTQLGYTRDEFLKLSAWQIYTEESLKLVQSEFEKNIQRFENTKPDGKQPEAEFAVEIRNKNGDVRWCKINLTGNWKNGLIRQ